MRELALFPDAVYERMIQLDATKRRRIHLNEEFNETSMFKMRSYMEKIKRMDDEEEIPIGERKSIELVVNSYGGTIYEMLATVSLVETFKEKYKYEIITTCTGKAMSCGSLLLMVGSKRRVYRYGTVLIHKLSAGAFGNYDQLTNQHEEHVRLQNLLEKLICDNTKIDMELLHEKTQGIDWYIAPEECVKLGIVDEII